MALDDALTFVAEVHEKNADGLDAEAIARALGHRSIKTKGFSTRLSAARQFGLLELRGGGYRLTDLARALRSKPTPDPLRRAFLNVPLYANLLIELGGKPLPMVDALASHLFHDHQLSASARRRAAVAFLDSARQASLVGPGDQLRLDTATAPDQPDQPVTDTDSVRIVLRLRGDDAGKVVEVRAPESITRESLSRINEAILLHVRVEGSDGDDPAGVVS